jgi:hypothetical protein
MNPNYPAQASAPSPVLGIVSLVAGIAGLAMMVPTLLIWLCGIIPFILGIAAVILGILGISRVKRDPAKYSGKGLAIAGILIGMISIIAPVLWGAVMGLLIYMGSGTPSGRFY